MTEAEEQAFLAEASDPGTAPGRLNSLFDMVSTMQVDRIRRQWGGYPTYVHTPAFPHALSLQIAQNPNIDIKIIRQMTHEPDDIIAALLDNPALPLPFEWQHFSKERLQRLRSVACGMNHPLFPALAHLCKPEWRSANAGEGHTAPPGWEQRVCGDASCAICYPYLMPLSHRQVILDESTIRVDHTIGDGTVRENEDLL